MGRGGAPRVLTARWRQRGGVWTQREFCPWFLVIQFTLVPDAARLGFDHWASVNASRHLTSAPPGRGHPCRNG